MLKVKSALSLCGEFETVRAPSWVPSRGSLRDSYMGSFKGFFQGSFMGSFKHTTLRSM